MLLRRPSAFLPIVMSLAALGLVVWFVASFGVVRGAHDEGAAARWGSRPPRTGSTTRSRPAHSQIVQANVTAEWCVGPGPPVTNRSAEVGRHPCHTVGWSACGRLHGAGGHHSVTGSTSPDHDPATPTLAPGHPLPLLLPQFAHRIQPHGG
jgi:hypothetical protein